MKILIADDDPLVLESCRRILESPSCKVILVNGTDQALAVLAEDAGVDLVITDIKMPGRDGVVLVEAIQARFPALPVLIMTGYLIDEITRMGREKGHRWFLAKPFTPDELMQGVRKAIGGPP